MGTRARLSQERSRQRRDELLTAAIELFAEGGSRAITHRAVAARAGLPAAATTYYFASIDGLIHEALATHLEQWARELEELSDVDLEIDVTQDDAAAFVRTVFAARGPEVAALELSIFLAASRVPELRDHAARAIWALESLTTAVLRRAGVPESAQLSGAIVSLIAGTALRRQSGAYSEEAEARLLTSAIRDLVAAHLVGADGIDDILRGMGEIPHR